MPSPTNYWEQPVWTGSVTALTGLVLDGESYRTPRILAEEEK